ncbi:A disintegrin and metalloproteinase with thrombospondin motifs 3-like [Glandiceps talaboti]
MTLVSNICFAITAGCLLVIAQVQGGLIPEDRFRISGIDRLTEKLSDYEITIPYLSTPEGRFISHQLNVGDNSLSSDSKQGVRNRRSPQEEVGPNSMHFTVRAFGSQFTLNVKPNTRLVAPNAVIEWMTLNDVKKERIGQGCFYVGEVQDTPRSAVAISNCEGLAGMIQLNGEDYFIEPLEKNTTTNYNDSESSGQKHVIYKRSAIKHELRTENGDNYKVASPDFLGQASALLGQNIQQRIKRSTGEKNIEVLLTADHSVVNFHGSSNIQLYLLTLMNIVNKVYKHDSLTEDINIVLVRIILLDTSQDSLIVLNNPSKSLENVCVWANFQQNKDSEDSDKPHHDHAIFLTRQIFGPAGYAPVTGMCHLLRSCTLNQEDGFASAFVVAHETGHVLGMEHDGHGNTCKDEAESGSIMAPLVQANFNNYYWSACSRQEISKYIDSYTCLDDDPFEAEWPEVEELPGMEYSADDQCRFDFGDGYIRCSAMVRINMCQQLWCTHPDSPYHCKTKKGPPLDGTSCGSGMYCMNGACVVSNVKTTHGGWSEWGPYNKCSRSCGIGAQMRIRECNNPKPTNGGDECKGQNVEFRLCSTEDCPEPSVDFRAVQCESNYKNWRYKDRKHTWLPHENKNNSLQCKLTCISEETLDLVVSSYNVKDGTRCSYDDPSNICVQGQCQTVGCDKQLGSSQTEDSCGICGGDNSQCENVRDVFHKVPRKKFQRIVMLPRGARHIDVYETSPSAHLLAVKEKRTGHYLFKSEGEVDDGKEFFVSGTMFHYSLTNNSERLIGRGPLLDDVAILVQSKADPEDKVEIQVSYKYVVKKSQVKNARISSNQIPGANDRFHLVDGWSECSKECGGGYEYYRFSCQRKLDGKVVNKRMCKQDFQPQNVKRRCNTQPCERASYDWKVDEWEYCSKTCGNAGMQIRTVNCMKTQNGRTTSVHHRHCDGEKPNNRQTCNRQPCPAYWQTSEWSECSKTCGGGTQRRQVVCGDPSKSVDWICDYERPEDIQSCDMGPCGEEENHCLGDQSIFCSLDVLSVYCSLPGYSKLCCRTCNDVSSTNSPAQ